MAAISMAVSLQERHSETAGDANITKHFPATITWFADLEQQIVNPLEYQEESYPVYIATHKFSR